MTRRLSANLAGTAADPRLRRTPRCHWAASNSAAHARQAATWANACSRTSPAAPPWDWRSTSEPIRCLTFSQLITSLGRLRRQSQERFRMQRSRELIPQSLAAPQDSRFHGSQRNAKNGCDLVIAEVGDVPQRHGLAKNWIDALQSGFDQHLLLAIDRGFERRAPGIGDRVLPARRFLAAVEIHLAAAVAEKP